jgi:hypothetical protein
MKFDNNGGVFPKAKSAEEWDRYIIGGVNPKIDINNQGSKHYTDKSIQPWDAMQSWMCKSEFKGFLTGNVIKYIARYNDKGGADDLKKAKHYLEKLIEFMEVK